MRSVSIIPMFEENITNPYRLDSPISGIMTERRYVESNNTNSTFPTPPRRMRNGKVGQLSFPQDVRRAGDYRSGENTPAKVSTASFSTVNTTEQSITRKSPSITRSTENTSRPRYSQNNKDVILGWHTEGHNKEKIIEMFRETFGGEREINAVRLNSFLSRWAPKQDRSKEPELQPQVRAFQVYIPSFLTCFIDWREHRKASPSPLHQTL